MTISYTSEGKFPLLDTGASNWGAVINGVLEQLDKGIELSFIAGENLLQYDTVYIFSANIVKKAYAGGAGTKPAIGLALSAAVSSAPVKVRVWGWVDYDDTAFGDLGASAGNTIYLANIAGKLTITPYTDYPQVVGIAKTATVSHITRICLNPVTHVHQLVDKTSSPTFAGLTLTGFSGVIKATAGVLAGNAVHGDLGGITADQHHAQVHGLVSANHTVSGLTIGHVLRATAADAFGFGTVTSAVVSDFNEAAQDAVGGILTDSSSIDFTYDDNANTITAVVLPGGVDHNSLQNFVANKHIDHSGVSISAGTGLAGGGDITSSRTLSLSHLGIESLADPNADRILFWDDSETASKWLLCGDSVSISGTTLDTVQDIRASASPTFAGLTLTGLTTGQILMGVAGVITGYSNLSWNQGEERLVIKSTAATWVRTLSIYNATANSCPYLQIGWSDASTGLTVGYVVPNPAGANYGWISHSGLDPTSQGMIVHNSGRFGIWTNNPGALLHIDQSSATGAIPVLTVDQADVSEEFIRYIGTSANGVLTQSLVEAADVSTATLVGYKKIYVVDDGDQITDGPYFVPFYTLA